MDRTKSCTPPWNCRMKFVAKELRSPIIRHEKLFAPKRNSWNLLISHIIIVHFRRTPKIYLFWWFALWHSCRSKNDGKITIMHFYHSVVKFIRNIEQPKNVRKSFAFGQINYVSPSIGSNKKNQFINLLARISQQCTLLICNFVDLRNVNYEAYYISLHIQWRIRNTPVDGIDKYNDGMCKCMVTHL